MEMEVELAIDGLRVMRMTLCPLYLSFCLLVSRWHERCITVSERR